MDETGVKFLFFFVGIINSKRHFIRKNMAMWYKLTSTVRRQKHDSKSLYYFQFFVPEEGLSFNPKYQENFLKYIFYIFYFTVLTIF